jgi:hypothetical protein
MKTKLTVLLLMLYFSGSWAQTLFSENMGSPTGTTTIANTTFQNSG